MREVIELSGMIIAVMPVGELDKRLTILTKERGKIFAFARYARKPGSALMGYTRLFAYGNFKLYETRDAYSLISANILNFFEDMYNDMVLSCYGSYFLELTNYYAKEALREPDMLKLIYVALTALTKPALELRLTRRIFELRLMAINGEYEPEPDSLSGETAKYAWHYILTSSIEKLYTFKLKEDAYLDIEVAVESMLAKYIDKTMHSLEVLRALTAEDA